MTQGKKYTTTLLLSFFLGLLGIHRFYTGYIGLGILQLVTFGCFGIFSAIDFIKICFNDFKSADGKELIGYNKTLGFTLFYLWIAIIILKLI